MADLEVADAKSSIFLTALLFVKANFLWLLILVPVVRGLYHRYASPLRKYPGPFLASCSRLWKFWSVYRGHTEHDLIKLHERYGPIVRLSPNEVTLSSCNAPKDIFTVGKGFHKTNFYWVFPPPENPDIFTEVREWKHAQMKRFAVTPYSLASMQKLTPAIEDVERLLLEKLDVFANDSSRACDLGDWLHWFAFDVLGEIAFSRRYGFLDQGRDVEGCIKYIDDMQWYDGLIGQVPWLHYFLRLNPLKKYVPGFRQQDLIITRMALEELKKRKAGGEEIEGKGPVRNDLLAQLFRAHGSNPQKFSEDDVFSVAHGAIFAGSDSTASTMQSFFHLVLNHPNVYDRLTLEVNNAQASGKLSELVQYNEAQELPYFQACLKEAMRCRPAVGLNITRHVPPGGTEIDGTFYAGGTEVAVNGWVLHRDQSVFGKDAEDFRPDRWLEGANVKEMERNLYQFGGGSHLCIGRNLALLEINKLLPHLLREYKFDLVYPGRPMTHHSTFFVVQKGLEVYVSKRERI